MRVAVMGIGVIATAAVGLSAALPALHQLRPESMQSTRAPRLFKDSRQLLAMARAQGRRDVTLVIASVAGRTADVAREATRLGGDIRFRGDEVGYLRVRLPIDRANQLAESANIEAAAADLDDSYPNRLTPAERAQPVASPGDAGMLQEKAAEPWPPKSGDYPLRNPYSPIKDLGAAELLATHPTYDGRGVTIALLDGNLDLLLPEFQTAYMRDGTRVPKVADFLNVTDPRDDAELNPPMGRHARRSRCHERAGDLSGQDLHGAARRKVPYWAVR